MTYWLSLIVSVLFGGLLGLGYFGGLWVTVRRMTDSDYPKLLLLGSFLARTAIVLAGFYAVTQFMGAHWEWLALSLLGFVVARLVLVRRWGPDTAPSSSTDLLRST